MRIVYRITGIIFACLVFSSCITTQSVPIDQLEPGKITLPAGVRKVALISRNFKFSVDTLSEYLNYNFQLKKGNIKDNKLIDSISVSKSQEGLRKSLLESGRFDEIYVYPFNTIRPHKGPKELPMAQGFIQSICKESETDAVISLEMLSFFYTRHNSTSTNDIQGEANVKITAIWSVYTPKNDGPVDRYTHSEVVRWKEYSSDDYGKKYKLPGRKEAIAIACGVAAKNYSKRIVPYWAESSRLLIGLNDQEFDNALILAKNNKWKEAAHNWEKYLASSSPKVSGVAALNFAISQEMLGDMEQANIWSERSVKLLRNGEAGKIARSLCCHFV